MGCAMDESPRDLKPENILLRNHVAKVGDFGLFTTRADGDITEGRTPSFPLGPSSPKVQHQRSEWSHNGASLILSSCIAPLFVQTHDVPLK